MESKDVKITEKDVMELMDFFTAVPVVLLKGAISSNMNAVKTFENQIESYKTQLTPLEKQKIKAVTEMPVPEIQKILYNAYERTNKKQLKILADPKAEKFISRNLNELKLVLFG
ncbi:hypothetical protein [Methanobacterium sp. ACI-7]|uniref:hypothetical protein n=1 Tax=unclassified Methanobacterium TaxID=2627676 RepID=UPI0039C37182